MNNKIENKQITLEKIKEVANYLEDYKEEYEKKFEKDNRKNEKLEYGQKRYEYGHGICNIKYEINEKSGKTMFEKDYNWFVSYFTQAEKIKYMTLYLNVSFDRHNSDDRNDYEGHAISIYLSFWENKATIDVTTRNQEDEAHRVYEDIKNILENTEERWNNTIKHRRIRYFSFCTAVGIILSYIFWIILKVNMSKIPIGISNYLNNKNVIIIGQWIVAIVLGNIARWYIASIYRPIIPYQRFQGFDESGRKKYKDDISDFVTESEVHFGQYWDAENRREKIEKIYNISKKILLIQLIISFILYLFLK